MHTWLGRIVTLTSCSLWTRGPSGDRKTIGRLRSTSSRLRLVSSLTLSGGAPAGDGAPLEERQRARPDVNGTDKLVEDQRLLQPQQSQVPLLGASVVAMVTDDSRDPEQLHRSKSESPAVQLHDPEPLLSSTQWTQVTVSPVVHSHGDYPSRVFQPELSTVKLC